MIPVSWAALAVAIALALGAVGGHRWAANVATVRQAEVVINAVKLDRAQRIASSKVETVYVDRIEKVDVPVEVIRTRLVRSACELRQPAGGSEAVPGSDPEQSLDAAAASDPDAQLLGDVAAEIPEAVANTIQLEQLQALIRANAERIDEAP